MSKNTSLPGITDNRESVHENARIAARRGDALHHELYRTSTPNSNASHSVYIARDTPHGRKMHFADLVGAYVFSRTEGPDTVYDLIINCLKLEPGDYILTYRFSEPTLRTGPQVTELPLSVLPGVLPPEQDQ